ncbi:NAD(P)/FAD-dependent oxidoreductase [Paenibacillus pabuli]|uniref:NAD(P)/FAD-dependent oxidoreductase n=1 Tax=Paenibacillus pabuli TaxID=1472 RepID=UPI0007810B39|nr:NAD(P)/FAD-dependent oxidoreductase [Paenibacillus pabuli]MEC0127646.1 NAD(P)/FAD-dependent oxidoreductase [Paenibacillus pabuli]
MNEEDIYDVTIIGGGPAGMYAAFYAGMREMKVKVIEGKDQLGGFLHTYSDKTIWDVGGVPPMTCSRLIEWLVQQANTFDPTVVLNCSIERFTPMDNRLFALHTSGGELHYSRTIIIAIGRGIAEIQRLDMEEAHEYERSNLHYTVQSTERFKGKHVLISGGGNSAVDWTIELAEQAKTVTVVHRQEEFRAMERNVKHMKNITDVRTPYQITQLYGNGERIHQVAITHVHTGENILLEVDEIVVSHGYTSHVSDIARCGLEMSEGMIVMSRFAETNIPGIFSAGDCATHESKVRLIAGAFNDAIVAVNSAKQYLNPQAPQMAYVSSHNDLFREKNRQITGWGTFGKQASSSL